MLFLAIEHQLHRRASLLRQLRANQTFRSELQLAAEAARARALSAKELSSIYDNRSWRWNDGAAHFKAGNRAFIAWVHKGSKATYADGSWSVDDRGHLCFRATWHGVGGQATTSTCFEHRTDDKNIYQRKLPNGKWYVFSHIPQQPDDEIHKIEPGDRVSSEYRINKTYVGKHARSKKR